MKLIMVSIALVNLLHATVYVPTNADEVILSIKQTKESKHIGALVKELESDKENLALVDELLSLYITTAKTKSDPRYMGYAQALLKPYLKTNESSYMLQMHNIDILQYNHHFDEALSKLKKLTDKNSREAKPYLITASIYQAQEKYAKALSACKQLIFRSSHLLSTTCITTMNSKLGKLESSYTLLDATYEKSSSQEVNEKLWALGSLADMSLRLQKTEQSKAYLLEALALNSEDYFIRKKLADIYLNEKKFEQVVDILEKYSYVDSLLIRLSIAKKSLGSDVRLELSILQEHLKETRLRKESAHKEDVELLKKLEKMS